MFSFCTNCFQFSRTEIQIVIKLASRKFFEEKMRVLNVAEKNDAAKNISYHLSGGRSNRREGKSKFNKIYEFSYNFNGSNADMIMTSVSGHLLNYEFAPQYTKWHSCSPEALFDAPVVKMCPKDYQKIKATLEQEIKNCDALIIWTDCDREGENIGYEIISVCTAVKRNIRVFRARFSEITWQSVTRAMQNLDQPNKMINDAVDVRSELDLRIGASFTRFQTMRLQKVFPELLGGNLISYGPCQFPTLGFVVERYKAIENFIPEPYWKIKVTHLKDNVKVEFTWDRGRLFDELFCQVLLLKCRENPVAKVEQVQTKPKSKWRPVPLDTVEFEKAASRKLKLNAKEAMKIAEKLYSQGFISYPRTETNIFPKEMNLNALVQEQTADPRWQDFASGVLNDGPNPRNGKKSDQAHPPIHPIRSATGLSGNEAKVYEYVVRHFLACVSKDAEGLETVVHININNEKFVANGLIVLKLNYLEVFTYEKWSDKDIHAYKQGETFEPTELEMVSAKTTPPNLLTEADLITLMEKHGIGTDATHAEHIETIKDRLYIGLEKKIYFVPGQLGIGLVDGYDSMGYEMSKPHLRAELEADLKRICDGLADPKEVLRRHVENYKNVFINAAKQAIKLDVALTKYLGSKPAVLGNDFGQGGDMTHRVMKCSLCGGDMMLKSPKSKPGFFLGCNAYPSCTNVIWFPPKVKDVKLDQEHCPTCGPDVKMLLFTFLHNSMQPHFPDNYKGCVGCDVVLLNELGQRRNNTVAGNTPFYPPPSGGIQPQSRNVPNLQSDDEWSNRGGCRMGADRWNGSEPDGWNRRGARSSGWNGGGCGTGEGKWSGGGISGSGEWSGGGTASSGGGWNGSGQSNSDRWDRPGSVSNRWNPSEGSASRGRGGYRSFPSRSNASEENEIQCNCGIGAKLLTVTKQSANTGRQFYACSARKCNFFMWLDDVNEGSLQGRPQSQHQWNQNDKSSSSYGDGPGPNKRGRGRGGGSNQRPGLMKTSGQFRVRGAGRGAGTSGRKCGICREGGHYRKNCPRAVRSWD